MDRLLAKSLHGGTAPTIAEHTAAVIDALEELFGCPEKPSRLGRCWMRFFKLSDFRAFFSAALAAAAFHDWGKACDGFQQALRYQGVREIRHEHLSGLMMDCQPVRDWLKGRPDVDWDVALAAVISHHLRVSHENFSESPYDGGTVRVYSDHEDFQALLTLVAQRLALSPPLPDVPRVWSFKSKAGQLDIAKLRENLKRGRLTEFDRAILRSGNDQRRRLLCAVRSALVVADAAGSAMLRLGIDLRGWIREAFDEEDLCTEAYILQQVIDKRIAELGNQWRDWSTFQVDCATLPARSLLLAPCGSGKTLAAWRWIASQCVAGVKRVIFLYPTRATATEGFRDYVSWAPESDAALVHGTAEYDLQGMFANPEENSDPRSKRAYEVEQRLYALGFWPRRIFSATIDQFFAFLQYGYGSMCLLPLLADSVVVVDEVHSLDRGLFSALKDFLKNFDVPVLCMTASLTNVRREELTAAGLHVYADKPDELGTVAGAPRYTIARIDRRDIPDRIREALKNGKRVMWVVNQVRRAQDAARQMWADLYHILPDVRLYCYHSRFRLKDRRDRHREVVAAFQGESRAALAITTQVCEMSLDLDADLLVTESAPITAMIQRMGRCNRAARPRLGAGNVLVYHPDSEAPYRVEEMPGVEKFIDELAALESVNQTNLEEMLSRYGPTAVVPPKASRFLKSGPYAMAGEESLRDGEEYTVPAILEQDLDEFLDLHNRHQPVAGLVLPVPRRFAKSHDARLPNYLAVVPDDHYRAEIGFCDTPFSGEGANP